MSLFQAKEWWGTRVSAKEEFDEKHLCIDNIDNSNDGSNKIIVGSFSGILRIYQPQRNQYSIENLLYESDMGEPIMQILTGNFKKTGEICLCVLHFKRVSFYYFIAQQGFGLQIKLIKEHKLERNAYNMCVGQFGQIKYDNILIQSCDAMLMIYEPEKFQCMCQLSTEYFPLPGALTYNPITDTFIIQNSCNEIEGYKYSNIVSSSQSQMKDPKRPTPNFTINIGEQAQKLISVRRSITTYDIIAITEQMLFVITQNGTIRNQKRFDYPPATIIMNDTPDDFQNDPTYLKPLTFTIASFTHHLLVYQNFQLVWAAKTDHICHGLALSTFQKQSGLLTLLNDEGWLQVIYLGTSIPIVQKEYQTTQKLPYKDLEVQFLTNMQKIQQKENKQIDKEQEDVKIFLNAKVLNIEASQEYNEDRNLYFQTSTQLILQCKVRVDFSCSSVAQEIRIDSLSQRGLIVQPQNYITENYDPDSIPLSYNFIVYASSNFQLISNQLEFIATVRVKSAQNSRNTSYCGQTSINLPFTLYTYLIPPTKSAEYKILLNVSKPISLFQMFADVTKMTENLFPQDIVTNCLSNPNALTFKLNHGSEVTILVGKNLDKWRIQSDSFPCIKNLLEQVMERRLQFNQSQITYVDQIPLQDIFNSFEEHFNLRKSLLEYEKDLEAKTIEFRTIQKKLLSRFKEKNNSSISSLQQLLQSSYDSMNDLLERTQSCHNALEISNSNILVVSSFLLLLIKIRFPISDKTFKQMTLLFPNFFNEEQIGWEEIVFCNINYFLRSNLKQNEPIQTQQYLELEDISKLNKIITILIDKISKGGIQ